MDAKSIIEGDAEEFARWQQWENPEDFKNKLETNLYNYYEEYDKLTYLYKVHSMIVNNKDEHQRKCKSPQPCDGVKGYYKEILFTEQAIKSINPQYVYTIQRPHIITPLITQNLVSLIPYPDAAKTYQSALDKMKTGKYDRNVLDDFRHCLESLLRNKLGNNRNIEAQVPDLGAYLKSKSIDADLRNMVTSQLTYYSKYQNDNVKHGDAIPDNEIEFAINTSLSLIRFLAIN